MREKPGKWTDPQVSFKVNPKRKLYHARAYQIPMAYYDLAKEEIKRFESLGVISLITKSELEALTFGRKKKTKSV